MIRFSANLGFLWKDSDLPDAIRAAGRSGFDAVECHSPYAFHVGAVGEALVDSQLSMVSLNTRIGDQPRDLGVASLPGREAEAREHIDEAIEFAVAIDCPNVSVLAGRSGRTADAERTYRDNLSYACGQAGQHGRTILIEPLNIDVADDYHLVSADKGAETIEAVGASNLKLMVDCFHTQTMHGGVRPVLERVLHHLGHVQIAAFPDRGEPTDGLIAYSNLLPWLVDQGYAGAFGAEYNPRADLVEGLSWMVPWHEQRNEAMNGETEQ